MNSYIYTGPKAFELDEGTLWLRDGLQLSTMNFETDEDRQQIRHGAHRRYFVWFVDDELGNRQWFRDYHREHWAVVTFSSRDFARRALEMGFPCDAVVTDIFFPETLPQTEDEAKGFLDIYEKIKITPAGDLKELWKKERSRGWLLAGFEVAKDFADLKLTHGRRIPVFLFSRKATLLLGTNEFVGEQPVTSNTYWLVEKPTPDEMPDAKGIAGVQRFRIEAVLKDVEESPIRTGREGAIEKHLQELTSTLRELTIAIASSKTLTIEQKANALGDVGTLESQLKKQKPIPEVKAPVIASLKNISEGAAIVNLVEKVVELVEKLPW